MGKQRSGKPRRKPTEAQAAIALARAWLAKGGFHEDNSEDPDERSPDRIEIGNAEYDVDSGDHFVMVRVYIPYLDIEHVVDGTHMDGIVVDEQDAGRR